MMNDRVIIENYPDNTILNLSTHPSYDFLTTMDNEFHIYEVLWDQGQAGAVLDHGSASASSITNIPTGLIPLSLRNLSSTSPMQVDWVFVRQYVNPEPSAVIGNDQTAKSLDLTVFLEGPYNGTDMNTYLNDLTFIPLTQPYNIEPWNYEGTESITDLSNFEVVDWILVELRDAPDAASATQATQIAREAALLMKDGNIVGLDGSSSLQFVESVNDHLFVVIWHRNHLGILSANFLNETDGTFSYDFSENADKAYGGSLAQKELGPGVWGMIGGDGYADGEITIDDKFPLWDLQTGTQDYLESDYNLDTQSDNKDKNDIWIPNLGSGSQIPD